jgi:hypothetical protein
MQAPLTSHHPNQRFRIRGPGWRIHGGVEDTKLSTNKQHTLSPIRGPAERKSAHQIQMRNPDEKLLMGIGDGEAGQVRHGQRGGRRVEAPVCGGHGSLHGRTDRPTEEKRQASNSIVLKNGERLSEHSLRQCARFSSYACSPAGDAKFSRRLRGPSAQWSAKFIPLLPLYDVRQENKQKRLLAQGRRKYHQTFSIQVRYLKLYSEWQRLQLLTV